LTTIGCDGFTELAETVNKAVPVFPMDVGAANRLTVGGIGVGVGVAVGVGVGVGVTVGVAVGVTVGVAVGVTVGVAVGVGVGPAPTKS
jgi:hypothetical protein